MGKEEKKSEGDLLYVGPAFVPVMRFKGKMYVEIRDFECCVGDIQRELENLSELNRKQSKAFKETMKDYRELLRDYMKIEEENKKLKEKVETLELWLDNKEKLNEEYRKQLDKYKRQYEHSMGFMEEDTLQELRDIGKL